MVKLVVSIILILFSLLAPHIFEESQLIKKEAESPQALREEDRQYNIFQAGYVQGEGIDSILTEEMIHARLRKVKADRRDNFYTWKWRNRLEITASAMGLDRRHHFANSYLVGFQPFDTDEIWIPLYTLATRKTYQYDHLQYSGLADVWQNSSQAHYYRRGDCEDHSIALADWLICLGKDARVVLGHFKGNGHAWVVLIHGDQEYLLEATGKKRLKSIQNYPLAKLMKGYQPKFQFNRNEFWVNKGSTLTTRYRGKHWEMRSRFFKSIQRSGEGR